MAARSYRPPREWLLADGKWPTGPFSPGAPPYVMVTAAIVANYLAAAGTRSLRSVARAAGIDATSLGLHGLPGDIQKVTGREPLAIEAHTKPV